MSTIRLTINGEPHRTGEGTTLEELLTGLGVPLTSVVVERNGRVVERGALGGVLLEDGDRLEVVRFVAGG